MKNPILVKRYTEGLAAALESEAEFKAVHRELKDFAALMDKDERLGPVLLQPFFNSEKKTRILEAILKKQAAHAKTARFLGLLLKHGRLEILPRVLAGFPDAWRESRGVRSFEVRSVVPLSEAQKKDLEVGLRRLEGRPIHCAYGLDPELIGGLTVRKGNVVYDVSLKGQLLRLQDRISER